MKHKNFCFDVAKLYIVGIFDEHKFVKKKRVLNENIYT